MIIHTPISLGELIDKISILLIKEKKITDIKKNNLISEELELLQKTLNNAINNTSINNYLNQLIDVNSTLWKIEDQIRDCEKNNKFDQDFIELARSVYITNDKRSEIKADINDVFDNNANLVMVDSETGKIPNLYTKNTIYEAFKKENNNRFIENTFNNYKYDLESNQETQKLYFY